MSTDELLRRLDELDAELKVRDRPERRAWNALEPNRNGWPSRVHDDQALKLWHAALRRFPDDLGTLHHLAIMHHARAIDTENSGRPSESDEDWRRALAYWHRLFEADEFWAWLAEHVDVEADLLPQVRQDFAERIIGLHFDIALDENSPRDRARFHVRLALDSPFPSELVERVRIRAYEQATAGLDSAVWHPDTIGAEALRPAVETVTGHLERDEECAPALRDLLGLLRRVQAGQVQQANASADPDQRRAALNEIRATARRYDGYVARLEPVLLEVAEQDPLLSDLVRWYSWAGQACDASRSFEEARGYYERALRAARAGADPRIAEISEDLARCLNYLAVDLLNSVVDSVSNDGTPELLSDGSAAGLLDVVDRADALLNEAASLNTTDAIKRNLATAQLLHTRLENHRRSSSH